MPTPSQIAEQVELERDQIRQVLEQLRNNTKNLEKKRYASATVYGISSNDSLLPLVVERIEHTAHRIKTRKNGRSFKEFKLTLLTLNHLPLQQLLAN